MPAKFEAEITIMVACQGQERLLDIGARRKHVGFCDDPESTFPLRIEVSNSLKDGLVFVVSRG